MQYPRFAFVGPTPEERKARRKENARRRQARQFGYQNPIWRQKRSVVVAFTNAKRPSPYKVEA